MREYWFFFSTGLPTSTLSVISLEKGKKKENRIYTKERDRKTKRGSAGWEEQKKRMKNMRLAAEKLGEGTEIKKIRDMWKKCSKYMQLSMQIFCIHGVPGDLLQYIRKNVQCTTRAYRILWPTMLCAWLAFTTQVLIKMLSHMTTPSLQLPLCTQTPDWRLHLRKERQI